MNKREFSFMYHSKYKELIKEIQKGMKELKQLADYDVKEERIQQTRSDIQTSVVKNLDAFVKGEKQRITGRKQAIIESYMKTRNVYKNPTEEILRRQDFDMEVASMDQSELANLVKTPGRTFTTYELNKLNSMNLDSETKAIVKRAVNENRKPFESDIEYQNLLKQETELGLIDNVSLQRSIIYLPSDSPQGFKSMGVASLFHVKDKHEFNQKMELLQNALVIEPTNQIPTIEKTYAASKEIRTEIKSKLRYEEFDPRIFKGAKDYDIKDRFKYLEERFNDQDTNRFDVMNPSYDVYEHLNYLEGQHAQKMQSDASYREAYQKAEDSAKNSDSEGIEA